MSVLSNLSAQKPYLRILAEIRKKFTMLLSRIPEDFSLLLSRLAIATVFWRSVQTKIDGWDFLGQAWNVFNVTPSAVMLFQFEYGLPVLSPGFAAHLATLMEFFLPILLVLGLASRFAAFGLFLMTCVIQFLVYPDAWPTHMLWFAILIYLMRNGAGKLSLDHHLFK